MHKLLIVNMHFTNKFTIYQRLGLIGTDQFGTAGGKK